MKKERIIPSKEGSTLLQFTAFSSILLFEKLDKIIENMSAAVKEAPAEEKPSSKMEVDNIDEDEDEGKFWLIFHKQICRAI